MFISNIIYKLSTIIYKPGIIYKATTTPTNKDPITTQLNQQKLHKNKKREWWLDWW